MYVEEEFQAEFHGIIERGLNRAPVYHFQNSGKVYLLVLGGKSLPKKPSGPMEQGNTHTLKRVPLDGGSSCMVIFVK